MQIDNNTKHTIKATQEFLKVKKGIFLNVQISHLINPVEHAQLIKTNLKSERPEQAPTEVICIKSLAEFLSVKTLHIFTLMLVCLITFGRLKCGDSV